MMNRAELTNEQLERVSGGWTMSDLTKEEYDRLHSVLDKLVLVQDGLLVITGDEVKKLLSELAVMEQEFETKYGA